MRRSPTRASAGESGAFHALPTRAKYSGSLDRRSLASPPLEVPCSSGQVSPLPSGGSARGSHGAQRVPCLTRNDRHPTRSGPEPPPLSTRELSEERNVSTDRKSTRLNSS